MLNYKNIRHWGEYFFEEIFLFGVLLIEREEDRMFSS